MGKRAKTDAIDAAMLAEFAARMRPDITVPLEQTRAGTRSDHQQAQAITRDDYDGT